MNGTTEDADAAVTALYTAHYRSLVRLSALLLRDVRAAEQVVQDSYVAYVALRSTRAADRALCHLRHGVVSRSRARLRRSSTAAAGGQHLPREPEPVLAALHALPLQQREVLVLRYYVDLTEAEIAEAMGVSRAAVKNHTARGMTALRTALQPQS